jgi:TolA-binding protein
MRCPRSEAVRGLVLATTLLVPAAAGAADSAYCRRVRAEAASEAARLLSPRVVAQGLRFPQNLTGLPLSGADGTGGSPFQARAGLALEPLEIVKGVELLRISDFECEAHEARTELELFVENAEGAARLPALRAQVEYLKGQQAKWQQLLGVQEQSFKQHVITVFELNQVRTKAMALDRRLAQAEGEAERLTARGYQRADKPVSQVVERWIDQTVRADSARMGVRGLSFWNFRFTGGVVASQQAPDWYAMAEFSVHFGVLMQDHFDKKALTARQEELRTERSGEQHRVTELQEHLAILKRQTQRELELVQGQLDSLGNVRGSLEKAESPNAAWAAALLACDELLAEAERAYLATLARELSTLLEEKTP